jgi:ribosome-binding protein aMBF1 (putative translation factor)
MPTTPYRRLADDIESSWTESDHDAARAVAVEIRSRLAADERLGDELARLRRAHQLSQTALAARAGVQQADISRIERGLGNPTRDTLTRLAVALGARLAVVPEEESALR